MTSIWIKDLKEYGTHDFQTQSVIVHKLNHDDVLKKI